MSSQFDEATVHKSRGPGLLAIFEKNPTRLERIRFLAKLFKAKGHELRIAGGAVRDILGGVEPTDIDFATTATPDETLSLVSANEDIFRIIVTAAGQRHGTVAVKFKKVELNSKKIKLDPGDGEEISEPEKMRKDQASKPEYDEESPFEITTLRCDTDTDGRHAQVEFVKDWKIDAERRDLTINAMFLTLDEGKLIDFYDGEKDLREGIVRFVGSAELRIREDYLRILRYLRFWSRYGRNKRPDQETLDTLRANMHQLKILSGERIWAELKKILTHLPCLGVLRLMLELELFNHINVIDDNIEKTSYNELVEKICDEFEVVETNVANYMKNLPDQSIQGNRKFKDLLPVLLFATIVRSQTMLYSAQKRLKFSNLEKDSINYIIENRTNNDLTIATLKKQLVLVHEPERVQTLIKMRMLLIYFGKTDLISELEAWKIPDFPISGTIVAQQAKARKIPGNMIKFILESLKHEWISSDYTYGAEELKDKLAELCENMSRTKESQK